jgi:hypothetical protein
MSGVWEGMSARMEVNVPPDDAASILRLAVPVCEPSA